MKFISCSLLLLSMLATALSFNVFAFNQDLQRSIQDNINRQIQSQMAAHQRHMETINNNIAKQMENTQKQIDEAVQAAKESGKELPVGNSIQSSMMSSTSNGMSTVCSNGVCMVCINGECTLIDGNKNKDKKE